MSDESNVTIKVNPQNAQALSDAFANVEWVEITRDGVVSEDGAPTGLYGDEITVALSDLRRWAIPYVAHDAGNQYWEPYILHYDGRGLLYRKKQILQALVGQDLTHDGDYFLRDLIQARRANRPSMDPDQGVAWLAIDFEVVFDWDLTG